MKGLEAIKIIDDTFRYGHTDDEGYEVPPYKMCDVCDEEFETVKKELKAFDVIKENFDIEAIVIKDYCYIEITSKICVMSKTQRAIKITPENKNKVEALGFVEGLKYLKQKLKH
jgi:hypothetical protein